MYFCMQSEVMEREVGEVANEIFIYDRGIKEMGNRPAEN